MNFNTATYTVKFKETGGDMTEVLTTTFADTTGATTVKTQQSGKLVIKGTTGELVLELSTPYTYKGGNLLMDITFKGASPSPSYEYLFYGMTAPYTGGHYSTDIGGSANKTTSFFPQTTFETKEVVSRYTVTAVVSPEGSGEVKGAGGTFDHGEDVTLTAIAKPGYRFVSWTDGSTEESTDATYTFQATKTVELQANFQKDNGANQLTLGDGPDVALNYTDSLPVRSEAMGTAQHNQIIYNAAVLESVVDQSITKMTFYADVATENWGGAATATVKLIEKTQSSYTINGTLVDMAGATTVYEGPVTITGKQMAFELPTPYRYNGGHLIFDIETGNGTASTPVKFRGIKVADPVGNYGGEKTLRFLPRVTIDHELILDYAISVAAFPAEGGEVTISGSGTYTGKAPVTVTATPNLGYRFVSWTKLGAPVSTSKTWTFPADEVGDATLVAVFADQNALQLTLADTDPEVITQDNWTRMLPVDTRYMSANQHNQISYPASSLTTLQGQYITKMTFYSDVVAENWGGATGKVKLMMNNSTSFYVGTASATEVYEGKVAVENNRLSFTFPISFRYTGDNLIFDIETEGKGVSNDDLLFQSVNLTGGSYAGMSEGQRSIALPKVTFDYTSTPPATYTVSVSANPEIGGTASVAQNGIYLLGTMATVTAAPKVNHTFTNWTKGGVEVSTNPVYEFEVTGNTILVANFKKNEGVPVYTINAVPNNPVAGSVTGAGDYDANTTVTLKAEAANSYTFVNWTENDIQVSTNPTFEFTATANRDLVANFEWEVTRDVDVATTIKNYTRLYPIPISTNRLQY